MNRSTFFIVMLMVAISTSKVQARILNVINFEAAGDGIQDDSPAFMKAWEAACGTAGNHDLVIPASKTYLLNTVEFSGPCNSSNIHVLVEGNIVAPSKIAEWTTPIMGSWVVFYKVNGLSVTGNGHIDGQGDEWWKCAEASHCQRPMGLKFSNCENVTVAGLNIKNSPSRFLSVSDCHNVIISGLTITNPETTPNTDGMDLSHSTHIQVNDCHISTGDDCIAILASSSNINITGVSCIRGHGISIGSLGHNGDTDIVEEVHVKHCDFGSSVNGAHIKTWQGGKGYVRKVTFENITLSNTSNPIYIDQFYCPHESCQNQTNAVEISDVTFREFRGTSYTSTAINLACSGTVACKNIVVDNINITPSNPQTKQLTSYCNNAHGSSSFSNPQVPCLLP